MLGTLFTPSRDRAKLLGFLLHLFNGWMFSLLYVAAFHSLSAASSEDGHASLGAPGAATPAPASSYAASSRAGSSRGASR
jgi:hypothetical protein